MQPPLGVPRGHLVLILIRNRVEASELYPRTGCQIRLGPLRLRAFDARLFDHDVRALAGSHCEHLSLLIRQLRMELARARIRECMRFARAEYQDVAPAGWDFGAGSMVADAALAASERSGVLHGGVMCRP